MSRFCDACGVDLDLHPWTDDAEGCEIAGRKADLLDRFTFGLFTPATHATQRSRDLNRERDEALLNGTMDDGEGMP